MNKKASHFITVILLLAAVAAAHYVGGGTVQPINGRDSAARRENANQAGQAESEAQGKPYLAGNNLIGNVVVVDINTGKRLALGTVDLNPILARIEAGESDAHRNDGSVFQNRESKLPPKPSGYYREYVVRTPGLSGPGPQRLVLGKQGEIYYSPDHYQTFIQASEGG